jgi:fatty acid desaturase
MVDAIPGPKEQVIPAGENLFKAVLLIALTAASFYAANLFYENLDSPLKWVPIGLLGVVDVVLMTGMGVLAHDAVHRVLFRTSFWNELWGGLLSALVFIPFQANRQVHLAHHAYAHQQDLDPEEAIHRHPFIVAFVAGATIGVGINYRQLVVNIVNGRAWRVAQDLFFLTVSGVAYFILLPVLGISLLATVVPLLLAFPPVFAVRAMSDHYGLPAVRRGTNEGNKEAVTGWVVLTSAWLEWLWSHVNYHEVHHKYPYLAHSYLPQVFAATRDKHPYAVVRGYWRSLLAHTGRSYYRARFDAGQRPAADPR